MTVIRIPSDFTLGVATSAYQIEGAHDRDGRSSSIWDTFSHTPGKVQGETPGDRGAEHYDRLEEDLDLLADLGVDSYRLSLSWSRLIPDGVGAVNEKGVAFYNRLIDALLARGIAPNVTLYHWDLPQVLEDRGGWGNREIADWFAAYARTAFDLFGDRVPMWATLNEPIALFMGYSVGLFAPGTQDEQLGRQAMHNAMLAHGRAVREFRESDAVGRIGIVIDVWKRHAVIDTPENHRLAQRDEDESFRFFFDELFAGGLAKRTLARFAERGVVPEIHEGDAGLAGEPIDFLGLNVYNRIVVDSENYTFNPFEGTEQLPGGNYLDNGMELYPDVLLEAVRVVRDDYGVSVPIYITENGTTSNGDHAIEGEQQDDDRIRYVSAFLAKAIEANAAGLGVEGYYVWTLTDNYEWAAAYTMKYGLFSLDPDTFDRAIKSPAGGTEPSPTIESSR